MKFTIKRLIPIIFVLTAVCAPVYAQLTPEENEQILFQIEALRTSAGGVNLMTRQLSTHPELAAEVSDVLSITLATRYHHLSGVVALLDMMVPGKDIFTMTRPEVVTAGLELIAKNTYSDELAHLDAILAECPDCNDIALARNQISNAENARAALLPLTYAEPRLAANLAMPGSSRDKSAIAGPHGDHRRFGAVTRTRARDLRLSWEDAAEAAALNADFIPTFVRVGRSYGRRGRYNAIVLGLAVGVEHPTIIDDLDAMEALGTTNRGREFFRGLLINEMLIGWDHLGRFSVDVFGRNVIRGSTYDLAVNQDRLAQFLEDDPAIPEYAKKIISAIRLMADEWAKMDNQAWNTIVLRYFTNIGPPGTICGEPGECPAETTCGAGTTKVGTVCVADACPDCPPPVECPTRVPVLDVLSDRILARCVVP